MSGFSVYAKPFISLAGIPLARAIAIKRSVNSIQIADSGLLIALIEPKRSTFALTLE